MRNSSFSTYISFFLCFSYLSFFNTGLSFGESEENSCFNNKWPYELSDIQPDPDILRGKLVNGLRYIIKENSEPEKRVALFLYIQAGSLNEKENQRGVAHFLEHMMFNGSEHFPPGSLIDYFQSIGMSFGSDANAHTTYDETVYRLVLPNGSKKELETGFRVMADYARGALLLESEIDRERGVILAEKRSRDSARYRTHIATTSYAFRGTKLPTRRVIGDEKTLNIADRKLLKSFYDSWYRPENMVLVVVGDIDPIDVEKVMSKSFSKIKGSGLRPDCPDFGTLEHKGVETFYHYEPELGKTEITIETMWNTLPENDSVKLETREIIRYIGAMAMSYRLQKFKEEAGTSFTQAGYYYGDIVDRIGYGSISAKTDPTRWEESLSTIEKILRQAIKFGFSKKEIERAKIEILAGLEEAVLTAKSDDSRNVGRKIIRHINGNRVYQSPEQEKELYNPIVINISVDEVNTHFREIWAHESRLISIKGDLLLQGDSNQKILDTYLSSKIHKVSKYHHENEAIFPYLALPEKNGHYVEKKLVPQLDIERIVFKNGLILNLKKTDFSENNIQLTAGFGQGELLEPKPGMAMFVENIVNKSGTGQLSRSELDTVLAGSSADLRFMIRESSFLWSGSALTKDFEVLIQTLYTLLLDPGFRETEFVSVKKDIAQMYQKIERDIDGGMPLYIQPFLASGNSHFGLPQWKTVELITYRDLTEWQSTIVPDKSLEISIVGDFEKDQVIKYINEYFGGLELKAVQKVNTDKVIFPNDQKLSEEINTSIEKSFVLVAWPTEDFWDISRTRRFHVLASIFEDRVRKAIRENMGATYSPEVYSSTSKTFKNYGLITVQMTVKPGEEKHLLDKILQIGRQLADEGITDEELVRAKKPLLTSMKDGLRRNNYWLYSVLLQSSRYSQQLVWPTTILDDYSSISRDEINKLAKKYLDNEKAATATITPQTESSDQ